MVTSNIGTSKITNIWMTSQWRSPHCFFQHMDGKARNPNGARSPPWKSHRLITNPRKVAACRTLGVTPGASWRINGEGRLHRKKSTEGCCLHHENDGSTVLYLHLLWKKTKCRYINEPVKKTLGNWSFPMDSVKVKNRVPFIEMP